jgi:endonuclease/exonuclease/phosphatase family metal-dependent hydrolase
VTQSSLRVAPLLLLTLLTSACLAEGDGPEEGALDGELPSQGELSELAGTRLRLMAGNLTTGSQNYNNGEGTRIFQGTRPDVAMVQEMKYGSNSAADMRAWVNEAFGSEFSYYRGSSGNIPNGIVSRYPILASGDWADSRVSDRAFTWARIDIPGTKHLFAVSVHLLTSSAGNRQAEAAQLVSLINANVDDNDYVTIAGDFNTGSRTEAAISTFSSVMSTSGPYPVDHRGNGGTNASRAKPYDWVLVSPDLHALATPTVLGTSSFPSGAVIDTRVYSPLSDIAPARSGDSGAAQMQHMGVVRDFELPDGGTNPTPSITVTSPNGGEQWTIGSTRTITWDAANVASVDIDYAANGTTYSRIASGRTGGTYTWTVPSPATTAARIRISSGSTMDASNAAFSVVTSGGGGGSGAITINEILANEPGSDTAAEFIEIYNGGSTTASLAGWRLSDSAALRHTFPAGTSLAPGARLVVSGSTASTGTLGLSNSGDSVILANSSGTTVDSFTYTSALSGTDGVSMNRSPDGSTGGFVLHTALSSASASPGGAP